jgi:hypothetical protein
MRQTSSFHLSDDGRFSVLLAVESLGIRNEASMSVTICERIETSMSPFIEAVSGGLGAGKAVQTLR